MGAAREAPLAAELAELAPGAGDELVPPFRGFDDEPLGRMGAAGAVPAVAVAPVLRVAAGAVFGRESGVC